mmetsp:Transcript_6121/g.10185  ORF Transcript_6121/g.10185 Transcript_6121/m.10185 type:complete len:350 (-) Transcript_6121:111-1160(-)
MSQQLKRKVPDRIEDLEERVRVLEAENAALKQQLLDLKDETIRLDLGSIPAYLKRGMHYANLVGAPVDSANGDVDVDTDIDVDDDTVNAGATSIISVPKKCFKADAEIRPNVELVHLLETLRYWMVDILPDSVIRYALNPNTFGSFKCVAEDFWVDMPMLKVLSNVARKGVEEGINEQILCALDESASGEIMYYLFVHHNTDAKLGQEVVIRAARLGSLVCLEYILGKDRCDALGCNICSEAAKWGRMDCLMYAHEHGCPWDEDTCSRAAENGHLLILRYAHEHGCPWNEETTQGATASNHLDCLVYAVEHGCPINTKSCLETTLFHSRYSSQPVPNECIVYIKNNCSL